VIKPPISPFSFIYASAEGSNAKLKDSCSLCNAYIAAISSAVMPGTSRKLGKGFTVPAFTPAPLPAFVQLESAMSKIKKMTDTGGVFNILILFSQR
jgi:hypothetical protein